MDVVASSKPRAVRNAGAKDQVLTPNKKITQKAFKIFSPLFPGFLVAVLKAYYVS